MKVPRRLLYVFGGGMLVIVAAALVIINLPLAPALEVSPALTARARVTFTVETTGQAAVAATATALAPTPTAEAIARNPTPARTTRAETTSATTTPAVSTPTPAEVSGQVTQSSTTCGRRGVMNVLIIGESAPDSASPRGADAIWMVRLDYDALAIRALAVPAELWVRTPQLANQGIEGTTLMRTYFEALQRAEGSERVRMATATNVLAQVLSEQLGLVADHYITIQPEALPNVIDALGGLSVDLPEAVDGTPDGLGVFEAGPQVLTGEQVLEYVRIYRTTGDPDPTEWERMARQRLILDALQAQLTQPEIIIRLPALLRHFYADVVTDLALGDTVTISCLARHEKVSIEALAISSELVEVVEGQGLVPNVEALNAFLAAEFTR